MAQSILRLPLHWTILAAFRARELLERALAIEERAYGPEHTEVAITLDNLGSV